MLRYYFMVFALSVFSACASSQATSGITVPTTTDEARVLAGLAETAPVFAQTRLRPDAPAWLTTTDEIRYATSQVQYRSAVSANAATRDTPPRWVTSTDDARMAATAPERFVQPRQGAHQPAPAAVDSDVCVASLDGDPCH